MDGTEPIAPDGAKPRDAEVPDTKDGGEPVPSSGQAEEQNLVKSLILRTTTIQT